jgi:RNA polymerase primary sigma factor
VLDIGRHPISLDRPVGEGEDNSFGEFIKTIRTITQFATLVTVC